MIRCTSTTVMTRDQARQIWSSSGLTYDDLTQKALSDLHRRIGAALKASDLIVGYRVSRKRARFYMGPAGLRAAEIYCSAYYFSDREAVTFNDGGFVGFAGWADETNVQPILTAFVGWVRALVEKRDASIADRHIEALLNKATGEEIAEHIAMMFPDDFDEVRRQREGLH